MSTHIDRNQTIVSHLKTLTSSKTENDFAPEKDSAFKQIQGILSSMEDKQRPLEDEMEQLKEILKNFGGTNTEVRLITSLSKKIEDKLGEMQKLQGDVEEQSATLSSTSSEEATPDDSGNGTTGTYSSGMTVGSGAQAQAAQILLELQEKYSELQALLQKIVQMNLSHSTDIVTSLATAASDSIKQDAANQRQEMYNAITGAVTSGVSLGTTVGFAKVADKQTRGLEAEQQILAEHQDQMQKTTPVGAVVSSAPAATDPGTLAYTDRLKKGTFAGASSDQRTGRGQHRVDAYNHMKEADRDHVSRLLSEKSTQKSHAISAVQTKLSRWESYVNTSTQGFNSGTKGVTESNQANNTDLKSAREGQRAVSQDSAEKQNQLVQKSKDDANQAAQQGGQVLKVRESIVENNRAAR